jgi:glutathione synthase
MKYQLGVVMDPISQIHPAKDTTLALLLEAQKRHYELFYFEMHDLFIENGQAFGHSKKMTVADNSKHWYSFAETQTIPLQQLDMILMRKDPPFNLEYIYSTYILELAEQKGTLVVNKPQSLRDANEKIFATQFADLCPPTLVTSNLNNLNHFLSEHRDVVFKPLDAMGGRTVFLVSEGDINSQVIIETLTQSGSQTIMAQKFIPEVMDGDKRILLIHGEPASLALNRVPAKNSIRSNLAAGGTGIVVPLNERDLFICQRLKDTLITKGLHFVGIDVINGYLTEINVTSPTGLRQIDSALDYKVSKQFFDGIEQQLLKSK